MKNIKPNPVFDEVYAIDTETNRYMIEIGLDQYADIFSEWDPAPFKRRALDPDLQIYLEGSSEEIPFRYPMEICFTLPAGRQNEQLEAEARQGLNNSLMFKRYLLNKELRKTNAQMLRFVAIGFGLLAGATFASQRVTENTLLSVLVEGLFISGWVFLWEAVSLFFFTNRDLYHRYRTYKRLQNALVVFREQEEPGKV